jgi:hypothetical protein
VSRDRPQDSPSSSSRTVIFQYQAQSETPKNNLSFQKTHQPNSVAWSQLAVEVLVRPVYSGSWICMEKFNSENNSSRTYRRELNAPIHTQTQQIVRETTTTTDAWQPSGRQLGRKEHEFLPLGVQGSTSRGSSERSRMRARSARGSGYGGEEAGSRVHFLGRIMARFSVEDAPSLVIPQAHISW